MWRSFLITATGGCLLTKMKSTCAESLDQRRTTTFSTRKWCQDQRLPVDKDEVYLRRVIG